MPSKLSTSPTASKSSSTVAAFSDLQEPPSSHLSSSEFQGSQFITPLHCYDIFNFSNTTTFDAFKWCFEFLIFFFQLPASVIKVLLFLFLRDLRRESFEENFELSDPSFCEIPGLNDYFRPLSFFTT